MSNHGNEPTSTMFPCTGCGRTIYVSEEDLPHAREAGVSIYCQTCGSERWTISQCKPLPSMQKLLSDPEQQFRG